MVRRAYQQRSLIEVLLPDGDKLWEHACKKLGIGHREVTPDGEFSLEEVECIGACSWAPAIQVDYDFHHFVTPEKLDRLRDSLGKSLFSSSIRRNIAIEESQYAQKTIFEYAPRSPGAEDYRALAKEAAAWLESS